MRSRMIVLALALSAGAALGDGAFITRDARPLAEPGQTALIVYQDGIEDLLLQVRYEGAREDFAWLVPTPGRPTPSGPSASVFKELDKFTRPPERRPTGALGGFDPRAGAAVQVLERQQVGVFDVSVLDASDPRALVAWLNQHGYRVAPRLAPVLDDYIRRGWYFTAMRVDPRPKAGGVEPQKPGEPKPGELPPIRLTFEAPSPVYPLKISSLNGGTTDLLLYLATPTPVRVPAFQVQFQRRVEPDELNRLTAGKPAARGPLWLTRISRHMASITMTQDLVFPLVEGPPR